MADPKQDPEYQAFLAWKKAQAEGQAPPDRIAVAKEVVEATKAPRWRQAPNDQMTQEARDAHWDKYFGKKAAGSYNDPMAQAGLLNREGETPEAGAARRRQYYLNLVAADKGLPMQTATPDDTRAYAQAAQEMGGSATIRTPYGPATTDFSQDTAVRLAKRAEAVLPELAPVFARSSAPGPRQSAPTRGVPRLPDGEVALPPTATKPPSAAQIEESSPKAPWVDKFKRTQFRAANDVWDASMSEDIPMYSPSPSPGRRANRVTRGFDPSYAINPSTNAPVTDNFGNKVPAWQGNFNASMDRAAGAVLGAPAAAWRGVTRPLARGLAGAFNSGSQAQGVADWLRGYADPGFAPGRDAFALSRASRLRSYATR